LRSNTSAEFNTGDGFEAGDNVTDGWYNTFIGADANCGSGGHLTNSTAIGNEATVTSSNHVVVGNSSITSIGGYVGWSNLSDGRVKKNIKQNVPGLAFINKLEPITYNLNLDAADKIINKPAMKDKKGNVIQPSADEIDSRKAKQQIVYTGFIAQDVEKAATSLNYDFSGVDKPGNANTLYGLRYAEFVVPLVKAVQELSKQNDSLKNENVLQQKINTDLEQRLTKLEAMMNVSSASSFSQQQVSNAAVANLLQNNPNPFSNSTTISYSIPQQFSSAKIIITDKNGNTLKQINLSQSKGSVNVDAATFSSGAYQYSLIVDGKIIASKQFIVSK
jgi:trimeric autotransporter adhesin